MMLRPLTIKDVDALLKDGNYTRAASLALRLSDDPLVAMLARELAAVGNKNREGRGRRKSGKVRVVGEAGKLLDGITFKELGGAMLYEELKRARMIVDGKAPPETVGGSDINNEEEARALLREHKLHKVATWQKFPAQARSAAAKAWGIAEEKIPR